MYISIEQAIDIYDELVDAKNGINGFGGSVAEIYVYKLMPYSPNYSIYPEGKTYDDDNRMLEKKAAEDFHSLCHIFAKKHDVSIFIDEIDMHDWISSIRSEKFRFYHRVKVEVKKISEENNV